MICGNRTSGENVLFRVERAESIAERLRGLLGRRGLDPGAGVLLMNCGSIHTFGMRFTIDVVFLTKKGFVTKIFRNVGCIE